MALRLPGERRRYDSGNRGKNQHIRLDGQKAVRERNVEFNQQKVKEQVTAGEDEIYLNASARMDHELEDMQWLIDAIQNAMDFQLCIDSLYPGYMKLSSTWLKSIRLSIR